MISMIEIIPNLFIGGENDYEHRVVGHSGWAVVHACKEPYHRQALGYKTRGAPKGHPEYLVARRGNQLILNLVDVDDPSYIAKEIVDTAIAFIDESLLSGLKVLIHCNQGESRAPSIGLIYMAYKGLFSKMDYSQAALEFKRKYPTFNPANGVRLFSINNWHQYCK